MMKQKKGIPGLHRLYAPGAIICLWYIMSITLDRQLIPRPHQVLVLFVQLILKGQLLLHGCYSLFRLLSGMAAALIFALPLGIAAGTNTRMDRFLSPLVYLLYPLPKIAFLPVFMVLFGLGDFSKILLLWTVIVFQLILAARDGVRCIPNEFHITARTLALSWKDRFLKLYLPSTLTPMFSALRISVGIGMAVLFFAENYATTYGLGYFIMNSWVMIDYPMMFAGILALGLVAALVLKGLDRLERQICPWLD